jgi:hypothetical protein
MSINGIDAAFQHDILYLDMWCAEKGYDEIFYRRPGTGNFLKQESHFYNIYREKNNFWRAALSIVSN